VAPNVTSRSIFLTWDTQESANQNGIIQMYTIDMTEAETGENLQLISEHTEFHLDKLHPYYTYSFVISAVTTGRGPLSTVYNVTTEEEGICKLLVQLLQISRFSQMFQYKQKI